MSTSPLNQIPPKVRKILYWVGYVVGNVSAGITVVWGIVAAASPDISMPLWLLIASAVFQLVQNQLNLLAGSNVSPEPKTRSLNARSARNTP